MVVVFLLRNSCGGNGMGVQPFRGRPDMDVLFWFAPTLLDDEAGPRENPLGAERLDQILLSMT